MCVLANSLVVWQGDFGPYVSPQKKLVWYLYRILVIDLENQKKAHRTLFKWHPSFTRKCCKEIPSLDDGLGGVLK